MLENIFYIFFWLKNKSEKPKKMVFQSENFEEQNNSFPPIFEKMEYISTIVCISTNITDPKINNHVSFQLITLRFVKLKLNCTA
jgi:hypothetical protein